MNYDCYCNIYPRTSAVNIIQILWNSKIMVFQMLQNCTTVTETYDQTIMDSDRVRL